MKATFLSPLIGACALATFYAAPTQTHAAAYGVVIGIDDYVSVSDLEGAVNDAEDIAAALRRRGADVIMLTNELATRSAVVGAMRRQLNKTVAGDVLVFSFAGHGVQLDEALVGDEVDGQDESFALHGFDTSGAGAGERLRDNDIAMILMEAPEGVSILFVADSCHSGTMTRAPVLGVDLGKTRFLDLGPIFEDPLPLPDEASFKIAPEVMSHVVFAAAARDNELTPEILIDGQRRGALSYSIARAIEGAADGGDGETTLEDLRSYVRAEVRNWSGARQTPDVELGGAGTAALASFLNPGADTLGRLEENAPQQTSEAPEAQVGTADTVAASPQPTPAPLGDELVLTSAPKLFVRGNPEIIEQTKMALGQTVKFADIEADATLLWDAAPGVLIDRLSADMLAEIATPDDLNHAIEKWRAVAGLGRWSARRALRISLLEGDGLHELGKLVSFRIDPPDAGPTVGRLTLFNLASGGQVQYLYPGPTTIKEGRDILIRGRGPLELGPSSVSEPTGADHLVAVLTPVDAPETVALRIGLQDLNGTQNPARVLALLSTHAGDPKTARVGVLPLFTVRP